MNSTPVMTTVGQSDTLKNDELIFGKTATKLYQEMSFIDRESNEYAQKILSGKIVLDTSLAKSVSDHVNVVPVEDRLGYAEVVDMMRRYAINDPIIAKANSCNNDGKLALSSALKNEKVLTLIQPDVQWMDVSLFYDYSRGSELIDSFENAHGQDVRKQGKGIYKLKSNDVIYSLPYSLYMACASAQHKNVDISTLVRKRDYVIHDGEFRVVDGSVSVTYSDEVVDKCTNISRKEYKTFIAGQLRSITTVEKRDKYFNVLLPWMKYHIFIGLIGCIYQVVQSCDLQARKKNKKCIAIPIYVDLTCKKVSNVEKQLKEYINAIDSRVSIVTDPKAHSVAHIRSKIPQEYSKQYLIPGACVGGNGIVYQTPGGPVTLIRSKIDPVKASCGLIPGNEDALKKIWACPSAQKPIKEMTKSCKWSSAILKYHRSKDILIPDSMEAADTAALVRDNVDDAMVLDFEDDDLADSETVVAPVTTLDSSITAFQELLDGLLVENTASSSNDGKSVFVIGSGQEFKGRLLCEFFKWKSVADEVEFFSTHSYTFVVPEDANIRASGACLKFIWYKKTGLNLSIADNETTAPGCLLSALGYELAQYIVDENIPGSIPSEISLRQDKPEFELTWDENQVDDFIDSIKALFV